MSILTSLIFLSILKIAILFCFVLFFLFWTQIKNETWNTCIFCPFLTISLYMACSLNAFTWKKKKGLFHYFFGKNNPEWKWKTQFYSFKPRCNAQLIILSDKLSLYSVTTVIYRKHRIWAIKSCTSWQLACLVVYLLSYTCFCGWFLCHCALEKCN